MISLARQCIERSLESHPSKSPDLDITARNQLPLAGIAFPGMDLSWHDDLNRMGEAIDREVSAIDSQDLIE